MTQHSAILPWLIYLPLLTSLALYVLGRGKNHKLAAGINIAGSVTLLGLALVTVTELSNSPTVEGLSQSLHTTLWTWISSGSLNVTLGLTLDPLSSVFLLLVTGLACLTQVFSIGESNSSERYASRSQLFHLFIFGMLVLVLAKNLLLLFLGWECVALCTYFLLKGNETAPPKTNAFVINRVASFALLVGIFLLGFYSDGDLDLSRMEALFQTGGALDPLSVPGSVEQAQARYGVITILSALFLLAAAGMSAQFPLHVWFTEKEDSTNAVSMVHGCVMTTSGIYLLCRLSSIFAISEGAMMTVALLGAVTALVGASSAMAQRDIKKVLSYCAVAQIGFVFVAFGVGSFEVAIFQVVVFCCFMPALFLAAALVTKAASTHDIIQMGGLQKALPKTRWAVLLSCAALAGVAPLPAFFAKEQILFAALNNSHHGAEPQTIIFGLGLLASLLSAIAIFRLYYLVFGASKPAETSEATSVENGVQIGPILLLAALTLLVGLIGGAEQSFSMWLSPVFAENLIHFKLPQTTELGLVAALLGLTGYAGWFLARYLYNRQRPSEERVALQHLRKFFHRGWYIDTTYELLFVRPFKALTALLAHRIPKMLSRSERGLSRVDLIVAITCGGLCLLFILGV